jgi:hypothetical protein
VKRSFNNLRFDFLQQNFQFHAKSIGAYLNFTQGSLLMADGSNDFFTLERPKYGKSNAIGTGGH